VAATFNPGLYGLQGFWKNILYHQNEYIKWWTLTFIRND